MFCVRIAAILLAAFISFSASAQVKNPADIPIEEFAGLPVNTQVRISPDGEYFSIISYQGDSRVLVLTPVGSQGVGIPALKGMEMNRAEWLNDEWLGVEMVFTREAHSAFGKINATRLMGLRRDGKKNSDLSKPTQIKGSLRETYMSDYAGEIIDYLPGEPDYVLLAVDEDGTDTALEVRKVDVTSGNYKLVLNFYEDIHDWTTDPSGTIRLGEGFKRTGINRADEVSVMYYFSPEENNWIDYTNKKTNREFSIAGFFDDPRYAYAFGYNEAGFRVLYKYDMINEEVVETLFEVENYDLSHLVYSRYTRHPVGVAYMTTKEEVHYFDEELAKLQAMVDGAIPGAVNKLISWPKNRERFIVLSESDIDSGSFYLFDAPNRRMIFLEAAHNGLDPRNMSPRKPVEYTARDGLVIPGYLTIPKNSDGKKLPTVILPHGGPQVRDEWGFDQIAQFLASRGYAVLQPNYRGSTGYGRQFARAGRHNWGLAMQDDVTDGTRWLIEQGIADPERVCIAGGSYGGYAALMGVVKEPYLYKCSISINGVSDLLMLLYDDRNFLGLKSWGSHIGDPGEDKEKLKQTSAYYNVDKIKTPVLLIATKDDTRVNYKQSSKFADAMEKAGKSVKYVEIKEGGHSILTGSGRGELFAEMEKFLATHIGGGE